MTVGWRENRNKSVFYQYHRVVVSPSYVKHHEKKENKNKKYYFNEGNCLHVMYILNI